MLEPENIMIYMTCDDIFDMFFRYFLCLCLMFWFNCGGRVIVCVTLSVGARVRFVVQESPSLPCNTHAHACGNICVFVQ